LNLPLMPGALDFFRSVEHLNPTILTACPSQTTLQLQCKSAGGCTNIYQLRSQ
jgi:hypothetical protein